MSEPTTAGPPPAGDTPPTTKVQSIPSEPAAVAAAPSRGRFTVLRPHAEGGLGRVSLARDERLRREVALKEIRPDRLGLDAVARFRVEAEITGRLQHPGIVPVYDLIEDEQGRPYYAMRFVEGRTLAEAIRGYYRSPAPLAFADLLRRFVAVCQTLAYAHSKGVIHRDLKPNNVMLGDFGETLVIDWGLAKEIGARGVSEGAVTPLADATGSDADLTHIGAVLGTPAYMPPEQARGEVDSLGPSADVYALGAILYQILTGKPPFAGSSSEALERVLRGAPPAPARTRAG